MPVCISSSTMWPARTEIGTEPAHHRPHMCDCDGAHIMHTKLSQPQNCHKPRRKRSKRTQSVQVIQPSPVAQQGCARGPGLNLPTATVTSYFASGRLFLCLVRDNTASFLVEQGVVAGSRVYHQRRHSGFLGDTWPDQPCVPAQFSISRQ